MTQRDKKTTNGIKEKVQITVIITHLLQIWQIFVLLSNLWGSIRMIATLVSDLFIFLITQQQAKITKAEKPKIQSKMYLSN